MFLEFRIIGSNDLVCINVEEIVAFGPDLDGGTWIDDFRVDESYESVKSRIFHANSQMSDQEKPKAPSRDETREEEKMNGTSREMTLREYMERLSHFHAAYKEYMALVVSQRY